MPTIEKAIVLYLKREASLALAGGRIYQDSLPQSVTGRPAIVVQEVSGASGHHQAGADGIVEARVQVDVWARDKDHAADLREALRLLLDGYPRGTIGADGEDLAVEGIHLENRMMEKHEPEDAGDSPEFQAISDFIVWHRETVPTFT